MIYNEDNRAAGCPSNVDPELLCVSMGGTFNVLDNFCSLGANTYDADILCSNFPDEAAALAGGSPNTTGPGWLQQLQAFDFGIFSNAYCNIAPILSGGELPQSCQPVPATGAGAVQTDDTPKTGRYVLAIVLITVVAFASYFIIKRIAKR